MEQLLNGSMFAQLSGVVQRMVSSSVTSWTVAFGLAIAGILLVINISQRGRDMTVGLASPHPVAAMVPIFLPYLGVILALTYWQTPLPGVGLSWPGLVTQSVDFAVRKITELSAVEQLKTLDAMRQSLPWPSLGSFAEYFYWAALQVLLLTLEVIGLVISSLAVIMTAIAIIVGPLCIPTVLTRHMSWVFSGWLRMATMVVTLPITLSVISSIVGNFCVNSLLSMSQGGTLNWVENFAAIVYVSVLGIAAMVVGTIVHSSILSGSMSIGSGLLAPILARTRINLGG